MSDYQTPQNVVPGVAAHRKVVIRGDHTVFVATSDSVADDGVEIEET